MTATAYADAVAALFAKGYELGEITLPEVVHQALDTWLRDKIELAIAYHAAGKGNGHQIEDRCEAWYALHEALELMHDESRRLVRELLVEGERP